MSEILVDIDFQTKNIYQILSFIICSKTIPCLQFENRSTERNISPRIQKAFMIDDYSGHLSKTGMHDTRYKT